MKDQPIFQPMVVLPPGEWSPEDAERIAQALYAGPRGLTKREYFAAMAMQGITANHKIAEMLMEKGVKTVTDISRGIGIASVDYADGLIEALNKSTADVKSAGDK